ncbi:hypothetical protein RCL_jg15314.t1 [Rhizophagus clarus]|uniref:Uncharacterized protein n=1 Tax=Rhizophagus clarus TaxID=94130 RepID=A0A8H3KR82_9GLOM|nr:hypothetical protein RCL_jg15314.t1 [Rhizophagus clarus]
MISFSGIFHCFLHYFFRESSNWYIWFHLTQVSPSFLAIDAPKDTAIILLSFIFQEAFIVAGHIESWTRDLRIQIT